MHRPDYQQDYFPHWMNIPIRFRDLDPLNHVNNAIFSTYYEEARINFIQDVPELGGQLQNGYSFVLANLKIDFISTVEYPAELTIGTGVASLGNTSISSFQAIYSAKHKKLISVAEAHGVWFNLSEQRPTPLPDIPNLDNLLLQDNGEA